VDGDAVGGHDEGLEVDAAAALEDPPYDEGELDDVVDGNGHEDDDDKGRGIGADSAFAYTLISGHMSGRRLRGIDCDVPLIAWLGRCICHSSQTGEGERVM
jgi:hypothetical protein